MNEKLTLAIFRLCDKNRSKIDLVNDFYNSLTEEEKSNFESIAQRFEQTLLTHKYGPGYYRKRDLISLSSIQLCLKLKEIGITVFPKIENVFNRAYSSDGCACWSMFNLKNTIGTVHSPQKVSECIKKKNKLVSGESFIFDITIDIEPIKQ